MSTQVLKKWTDVDLAAFHCKDAKANASGKGKTVQQTYENSNKRLVVQTPWMHVPFAVSVFEDEQSKVKKHTLVLSTRGCDPTFVELLSSMDEYNVQQAMNNNRDWFGDAKVVGKEIVQDRYRSILKEDPNGKYDPQFRIKLPVNGDNFEFMMYDETKKELTGLDSIQPGCQVRALLEASNVYIADKTFGQVLRAVQLQVARTQKIEDFAFADDKSEDATEDVDADSDEVASMEEYT